MANTERKMTVGRMIAYGSGDFFGGGAFFIVGSLFTVFLTTVVGISPLKVGTIFLAGKFVAAFANPIMGYISDHTHSRFGRRRIYFFIGCLPVFVIMWIPVDFGSENLNFLYYMAAFLVFNIYQAMVMVPYNSILPEMTSDYTKRSQAMGIRMGFSKAASLAGALLPLTIISMYTDKAQGYLMMGIVFGILFAMPWLFAFLFTWERAPEKLVRGSSLLQEMKNMYKNFASTMINRSFRAHMGMYLFAFANLDIFNGIFIFFAQYTLHQDIKIARDVFSYVQTFQIVALPLVTWMCCRLGNAITYRISITFWGLSIIALSLLPADANYYMMAVLAACVGLGLSGSATTPWNILAFMSDVDEMITAKRREGVYAGFMSFLRQLALGIGGYVIASLLAGIGFVKGAATQPLEVSAGIRYFIMCTPIVCLGIGFAFSMFFKVDPKNHAILLKEVARRKAGGKAEDVDSETKAVVETLTGHKYEKLWNPNLVQ